MKRILHLACAVLLAVGCTEEYEYRAPEADNGGIYFAGNETTEWVFGPDEEQTYSFNVVRRDSTEAHTYSLVASDCELGIPSQVSFEAGQSHATVTATAAIAPATLRRTVTVTAADGDSYTYGNPELRLTVSVANRVLECDKETYANNFVREPVTVYVFGNGTVDGRDVAVYGARNFLCDGYMLMFNIDAEGRAVVDMQEALYAVPYIDGVADKYLQSVEGSGWYDRGSNKLQLSLRYYIGGMNVYSIDGESLYFPANFNPLP